MNKKKKFTKKEEKPSHKWLKISPETIAYFKKLDNVRILNTHNPPIIKDV